MRIEPKFVIISLIAIALAFPVSHALEHRSNLLKIEKQRNSKLLLEINSKQKELKAKDNQIKFEQKKSGEQQNHIKQLKDELEARAGDGVELASATITKRPTGSCASYRGLVSQYNWDVNVALAVMQAESSCNTNDISPTCDHGIFQINCVHADLVGGNLALLHDPAINVRVAYAIYSGRGWLAWNAYTNGSYLKFL